MSDTTEPESTLELAGKDDIKAYTKVINGKVVQVKAYQRANNETAEAARKAPGRPTLAAGAGNFPGGRAVPHLWAEKIQRKAMEAVPELRGEEAVLPKAKNLEEATSRLIMHLKNFKDTPALRQLKKLLLELDYHAYYLSTPLVSDDVFELARGAVRIKSHWRTIKTENGTKMVHVKGYTMMRELASFLGGPAMAAKKGFTMDLMATAMAEENRINPSRNPETVGKARDLVAKTKAQATRVGEDTKNAVSKAREVTNPKPTKVDKPDAPATPKPKVDAPDVPTPQAPKETPAAPKRTFTHPSGAKFDLQNGEVLKQHKMNPDSLSVFSADGEMKYRIMPSGRQGAVPKNVNPDLWRDYVELEFNTPKQVRKTETREVEVEAPSTERRIFKHPAGTQFSLNPTDKVLRHRLVPNSYRVEDAEGNFRFRITPKGKAYGTETKREFYEEDPNFGQLDTPEDAKDIPEIVQDIPRVKVSEPKVVEQTPEAETRDVQGVADIPELTVYKGTESEAWNRGAMAYQNGGGAEPSSDAWVMSALKEQAGDRNNRKLLKDFSRGYQYAQQQEHLWRQGEMGNLQAGQNLDPHFQPDTPQQTKKPQIYVAAESEAYNYGVEWVTKGASRENAVHMARLRYGDNWEDIMEVMAGWDYADLQRTVADVWKKTGSVPKSFEFNPKLHPEAAGRVSADVVPEFDTKDNKTWRRPYPDGVSEAWKKSYDNYVPEFGADEPDFLEMGRENRKEMFQGWNSARKDWEDSQGIQDSLMSSEEWNRGYKFATSYLAPLPDRTDVEFEAGFNDALSNIAKDRLKQANRSQTPDNLNAEKKAILNARAQGIYPKDIPIEEAGIGQAVSPSSWSSLSGAEKTKFIRDPYSKSPLVLDRLGREWKFDGFRWNSPGQTPVDTNVLINSVVEQPTTLHANQVDLRNELFATIPMGSRITTDIGIEFEVGEFGKLFINGDEIPTEYAIQAVAFSADGRVNSYPLKNADSLSPNARKIHEDRASEVVSYVDRGISGLPDKLRNLVLPFINVDSPEGSKEADLKNITAFVKFPRDTSWFAYKEMPEMELPYKQLFGVSSSFDPNNSVWQKKARRDLNGKPIEGTEASWNVPGSGNHRELVVVHETGHFLEGLTMSLLDKDERRAMYSDMAEAVLQAIPGFDRTDYTNFEVGGKTYSNKSVERINTDYELARAIEYAMERDNSILPAGLSVYGTTNAQELIAESWAEYKTSPDPRPISIVVGRALEQGITVGVERLDGRVRGLVPSTRYTPTFRPEVDQFRTTIQSSFYDHIPNNDTLTKMSQHLEDVVYRETGNSTFIRTTFNESDKSFTFTTTEGSLSYIGTDEFDVEISMPDITSPTFLAMHEELVQALRNSGVQRIDSLGGSKLKAQMGYGWAPHTIGRGNLQPLVEFGRSNKVPIENKERWEKWANAIERYSDANTPTPFEVWAYGNSTDGGNALDLIKWDATISTSSFSGTPTYDIQRSRESTINPVILPPPDRPNGSAVYSKALSAFTRMSDQDVQRVVAGSNRFKSDNPRKQAAALVVDGLFGSMSEDTVRPVRIMDRYAKKFPEVLDGMDNYNGWANHDSNIYTVLSRAKEDFAGVNDSIHFGDGSPTSYALDRYFEAVPPTTKSFRVFMNSNISEAPPAGSILMDRGFLRGSATKPSDDGSVAVVANIAEGSRVLWDGTDFYLPRDTQWQVIKSGDGEPVELEQVSEPADNTRFVRPTHKNFQRTDVDYAVNSIRENRSSFESGPGSLAREAASRVTSRALDTERVTGLITSVTKTHGGEMEGIQFRVKDFQSTVRGLEREASTLQRLDPNMSNEEAMNIATLNIRDGLRYTSVFPVGGFNAGVRDMQTKLASVGFRSSLEDRGWRGVYATFEAPDGDRFEIVFHTPESAIAAKVSNAWYDIYRDQSFSESERARAKDMLERLRKSKESISKSQAKNDTMHAGRRQHGPMPLSVLVSLPLEIIVQMFFGIGIPSFLFEALIEHFGGSLASPLSVLLNM